MLVRSKNKINSIMTADKIMWHEVEKGDLPSEKIENKGSEILLCIDNMGGISPYLSYKPKLKQFGKKLWPTNKWQEYNVKYWALVDMPSSFKTK